MSASKTLALLYACGIQKVLLFKQLVTLRDDLLTANTIAAACESVSSGGVGIAGSAQQCFADGSSSQLSPPYLSLYAQRALIKSSGLDYFRLDATQWRAPTDAASAVWTPPAGVPAHIASAIQQDQQPPSTLDTVAIDHQAQYLASISASLTGPLDLLRSPLHISNTDALTGPQHKIHYA